MTQQNPTPHTGLAIQTAGLTKRYRRTAALSGLTMDVPRGEIFGFLGPNGAGKTTAVKLLLGLARPTSGAGWLLGEPIGSRSTRRRIGYLPELFRYQDWLSGHEVLQLHCELAGIERQRWAAEIEEALSLVGLDTRASDRVATYSKGMQQRLGLGVALLGRPDLIFLDEPTSALDPIGRRDVREVLRELKRRGATVFLNSHLLSEVEQVCDRVAIINRGSVMALSSVRDLLGGAYRVRLRLEELSARADAELARFGRVEHANGWYTVHGVPDERIPDLVRALVNAGARVHAVEPAAQGLEERFLQLLEDGR